MGGAKVCLRRAGRTKELEQGRFVDQRPKSGREEWTEREKRWKGVAGSSERPSNGRIVMLSFNGSMLFWDFGGAT